MTYLKCLKLMKKLGFRRVSTKAADGVIWDCFIRSHKKKRPSAIRSREERHRCRLQKALAANYPRYAYIGWLEGKNRAFWAGRAKRPDGYLAAVLQVHAAGTSDCEIRLSIDHGRCWNKPSSCPIDLHRPELSSFADAELEWRLCQACGKLATRKGCQISSRYFHDANPFKLDVQVHPC